MKSIFTLMFMVVLAFGNSNIYKEIEELKHQIKIYDFTSKITDIAFDTIYFCLIQSMMDDGDMDTCRKNKKNIDIYVEREFNSFFNEKEKSEFSFELYNKLYDKLLYKLGESLIECFNDKEKGHNLGNGLYSCDFISYQIKGKFEAEIMVLLNQIKYLESIKKK